MTSPVVPGAEYAQVMRMLGNGRLEAMCIDGIKRLCHIRGKMRKKVWVNTVRRRGMAGCSSALDACWRLPEHKEFRSAGTHHAAPLPVGWLETGTCPLQGDIVLVGLRDYQDEKADVILKCGAAVGCEVVSRSAGVTPLEAVDMFCICFMQYCLSAGQLSLDCALHSAALLRLRWALRAAVRTWQVHGGRSAQPQGIRRAAGEQCALRLAVTLYRLSYKKLRSEVQSTCLLYD